MIKKYMSYIDALSQCDDFSISELAKDEDVPLQGRAFMCAVSLDEQQQLALCIWCARSACELTKGVRIDRRAFAAIEFREAQLKKGKMTDKENQQQYPNLIRNWDQTMTALKECQPGARNAVACAHWLCFSAAKKRTIGCVSHFVATFENEDEGHNEVLAWILKEVK